MARSFTSVARPHAASPCCAHPLPPAYLRLRRATKYRRRRKLYSQQVSATSRFQIGTWHHVSLHVRVIQHAWHTVLFLRERQATGSLTRCHHHSFPYETDTLENHRNSHTVTAAQTVKFEPRFQDHATSTRRLGWQPRIPARRLHAGAGLSRFVYGFSAAVVSPSTQPLAAIHRKVEPLSARSSDGQVAASAARRRKFAGSRVARIFRIVAGAGVCTGAPSTTSSSTCLEMAHQLSFSAAVKHVAHVQRRFSPSGNPQKQLGRRRYPAMLGLAQRNFSPNLPLAGPTSASKNRASSGMAITTIVLNA